MKTAEEVAVLTSLIGWILAVVVFIAWRLQARLTEKYFLALMDEKVKVFRLTLGRAIERTEETAKRVEGL